MNRITAIIVISTALTAPAAIPLRWVVDVRSAAPATFEAYQGETIELTALLHAAGKPLAAPSQYSLYWQTNGMGSTYWSAPCTPLPAETNAMVAVWRPDYDVGARVYNCFIGAPSNIYHAAFQLRLRPSPGAHPNELPLPTPTIDCSIVTFLHPEDAPFSGGGGGGITAQDATNAAAAVVVRDVPAWAKAAEPPSITETDPTVPAWAKAAEPPSITETDPTVPAWAKAAEPPSITETDPTVPAWAKTTNPPAITETDPTVPAWAKAANPPQTGIDAPTATNIAEAVVARDAQPRAANWNRDGFWEIRYEISPVQQDYTDYTLETNANYQIVSNATAGITYGLQARCSQSIVDLYARDVPPVSDWGCLTPGASIDSSGILTATNSGSYRVRARTVADTRYCDVPLTQDRRETASVSHYIADATSRRQAVNDDALAAITAAEFVSSNRHDGVWYNEYTTPLYRLTQPGAGNARPFAVSPHVLISAAHYSPWQRYTGEQVFADADGNSATVRKTEWVDLRSWALTNGWTEIELSEMTDCSDIAFVVCDSASAVPDGCIPYLMSDATRRAHFGASLDGVQAWHAPQGSARANPVTMTSNSSWTYDGTYRDHARDDLIPARDRLGQLIWAYSGDSGRPIYIDVAGESVVVSSHHTATTGPDFCRALPVIRAFVVSRGDTLKEIE